MRRCTAALALLCLMATSAPAKEVKAPTPSAAPGGSVYVIRLTEAEVAVIGQGLGLVPLAQSLGAFSSVDRQVREQRAAVLAGANDQPEKR